VSRKFKYRISILAPFPPLSGGMTQLAQSLSRNLANDGHIVKRIDLGKGIKGVLPIPYLYIKFFKFFKNSDIIHIISASGNALWLKDLPAILITKILSKKVIVNFVGGMALKNYHNWPWYKKLPFKLADAVVVPTDIFRKLFSLDNLSSKLHKIPHVVDVENFSRLPILPKDTKVIIAAKSLEKYAGYTFLIDIFKELKKNMSNLEFWILGDGPEKLKLKQKVKNMNLEGVKFFGNVKHKNMPEIFNQGSIFVHATKYESFGLVLVEAMASSLPIVAFNIGGIPEVVKNGESGFLTDFYDRQKFIKAIKSLINDNDKMLKMSSIGLKRSQNYSWVNIKKMWYDIYSELTQ